MKGVLSTFVLDPALGYEEANAMYQQELAVWLESAKSLNIQPL